MPITFSDIGGLLKTKYVGPINDSVYKKVMLLNQVESSNRDVIRGSRDVKHPVRLTRNNATRFSQMGVTASPVTLPTPKSSKVVQAQSLVKSLYGYVEFDGETIRATMSDEGSFARVFQSELLELTDSMRLEINRALYGSGSGKMGTVDATAGAPDNYIDLRDTFADQLPNFNWFDEGQSLDFFNGAVKVATLEVSQLDPANNRIYFTTNPVVAGVVAGHTIYISGNKDVEPMGLLGIADDGAYVGSLFGISNTTYHRWNGHVDDNTAGGALRAIDDTMLGNMFTKIERTGTNIMCITNEEIRNKIARMVKNASSTHISMSEVDLKGGFRGIKYNGVVVYGDLYAPNHIFVANLDYLKIHQLYPTKGKFSAITFDDLDGQVIHGTRGYDIYWAKAVADYEVTCTRRNAFGRISDIDPNL